MFLQVGYILLAESAVDQSILRMLFNYFLCEGFLASSVSFLIHSISPLIYFAHLFDAVLKALERIHFSSKMLKLNSLHEAERASCSDGLRYKNSLGNQVFWGWD